MTNLLGLSIDELNSVASNLGMPRFAGKQMAEWIYKKHIRHISEMTNISLTNRTLLANE